VRLRARVRVARVCWRRACGVRVVLLIRFWHPDVPAGEYTARKKELDRAMKRHLRAAMMPPLF